MKKLIFGVGYNSRKLQVRFGNKTDVKYEVWRGMLRRCYSEADLIKHPTYIGCHSDPAWHDYSIFYDWMSTVAHRPDGWHLDKDLLFKGNKLYSDETCVFLPQQINVLFTKRKAKRGDYPIGVHYNHRDDLFQVSCNDVNGKMWHSYCKDPMTAFARYKEKKESVIKYWADFYKRDLEGRAYNALYAYEVEITD